VASNSPSLYVRVIGDLSGLVKSVDDAGTKVAAAAGKMSSVFRTALGGINATGVLGPLGDTLNGVVQGLDAVAQHGKSAALAMAGVGAAGLAIGAGLAAVASGQQASLGQLKDAIEATGGAFDEYADKITKADQQGAHFGFSTKTTDDALRVMTQGMGGIANALHALPAAFDLARAKHEDLFTAAQQLTRAYNGAGRILKEFGLTSIPDVTKATETLTRVTDAAASADQAAASAKDSLAGANETLATATKTLTDARKKLADQEQQVHEVMTRSGQYARDLASANLQLKASAESVTTAQQGLLDVQQKLYDIQHGTGQYASDAAHAQLALQHANLTTVESTNNLAKAQQGLVDAQKTGDQQKINDAMLALANAQLGVKDATQGQTDAQQHLKDITDQAVPGTKAYNDLQNQLRNAQLGVAQAQNAQVDSQAKVNSLLAEAVPGTKEYKTMMEGLVGAQQAVKDAQQKQLDAQTKITDAQAKYTESLKKQEDAHKKVADAQDLVTLAEKGNMAVVDELGARVAGQAESYSKTLTGTFERLRAEITNSLATFGARFAPLIMILSSGLMAISAILGILGTDFAATAAIAIVSLLPIVAIPLLIIGALIAVGVAAYIFRDRIVGAAQAVYHWFAANWPLLLAILLAPFTLGASLIWKFFGHDIIQWAKDALQGIIDAWNAVVDFFVKLPGRLASAGANMWKWIVDGFKDVINAVIFLWDKFRDFFQIKVHIPIPFTSGVHFDSGPILPYIHPLATGGIVTSPTLALLGESGPEAVVPLSKGMAPAVNIEYAQFNEPIDLDLLMKKVEFQIAAGLTV
jgi:hypothetical protein